MEKILIDSIIGDSRINGLLLGFLVEIMRNCLLIAYPLPRAPYPKLHPQYQDVFFGPINFLTSKFMGIRRAPFSLFNQLQLVILAQPNPD